MPCEAIGTVHAKPIPSNFDLPCSSRAFDSPFCLPSSLCHTHAYQGPLLSQARRCVVHVQYTIHSSHCFNGGSYELVLIHAFPCYVAVIQALLPFEPPFEGRKHPMVVTDGV